MNEEHGENTELEPIIEAKGVSKKFPGTLALDDVDFDVFTGKIHAITGENGAGKSTLIKLFGGVHKPTEGEIYYKGERVSFGSPREAIDRGIVTIHQEFSLAPSLSAEENIFLGQFPKTILGNVDRAKLRSKANDLLDRLEIDVDPGQPVSELAVAQQQMVEIAKALSRNADVLILDEPTAVLDRDNVGSLFDLLDNLRSQGLGLVYISHRLEEVFRLADEVTVLKDGAVSGRSQVSEVDRDWLVKNMIGREEMDDLIGHTDDKEKFGKTALEVESISYADDFEDITFSVREGEIVTLAGLVGAGRTEVAKSIFGVNPIEEGQIKVYGEEVEINSPQKAIDQGIVYLPENRKDEGLFVNRPVLENISLSNLEDFYEFPFLDFGKEQRRAEELVSTLSIVTPNLLTEVKSLSGGNQQKVVLARLLGVNCRILLLDEPTRGVDIGAKEDIYQIINNLSEEGLAIVLISSEMEEVVGLSDEVVVLRKGKLSKKLNKEEISEENIMEAAVHY